jgi:flagellar biosynthesis protein FlhF
MKIRSYLTRSVHEAIEKARFELGPEALLLDSRKSAAGTSDQAYEVTFGVAADAGAGSSSAVPLHVSTHNDITTQLAQLRQQIEKVQRSVAAPHITGQSEQKSQATVSQLLRLGFTDEFARELIEAVPSGSAPVPNKRKPRKGSAAERSGCSMSVIAEIERRFSVAPELGNSTADRKIVLLVGPPGAGKTSTLVKLAITYGTRRKIPIHLISTDTLRVGGAEQLQAYARILGASFESVHGVRALAHTLEQNAAKQMILIDTPGFSPADKEEARELSAFINQREDIDVQLVLPATSQIQALRMAQERLASFRPTKLIFTHVDEMNSPASLIEAAVSSKVPISFITNGQQIPEDLDEANKPALISALSNHLERCMQAAA